MAFKLCSRNHLYIVGIQCKRCKAITTKAWKTAHKDRCDAQRKADYEKRKQAILAKNKIFRELPENKEKARITSAKWYRDNKLKAKNRFLLKAYGLANTHFDGMLADQMGLCLICRENLDIPHVDHDHISGEVRGLLCSNCNTGLGLLKDSPQLLNNAITYLSR